MPSQTLAVSFSQMMSPMGQVPPVVPEEPAVVAPVVADVAPPLEEVPAEALPAEVVPLEPAEVEVPVAEAEPTEEAPPEDESPALESKEVTPVPKESVPVMESLARPSPPLPQAGRTRARAASAGAPRRQVLVGVPLRMVPGYRGQGVVVCPGSSFAPRVTPRGVGRPRGGPPTATS